MKNIKLYGIITFLFIINVVLFSLYFSQKEKINNLTPSNEIVFGATKSGDCKIKEIQYGVSGRSMEPLIKDQQKVKVQENYYCNGKVNRGDIIIYESSSSNGPIIKQIKALPGDKVKFKSNKMIINGIILKNSVGTDYMFKDDEIKYMSMYIQNSILQDGSFLAFGDNVSESIDSRKMGGIGINNFKGKVILK